MDKLAEQTNQNQQNSYERADGTPCTVDKKEAFLGVVYGNPLAVAYIVALLDYFATFFVAMVALSLACLIIHRTWEENCGSRGWNKSWLEDLKVVLTNKDVILLGLVQVQKNVISQKIY